MPSPKLHFMTAQTCPAETGAPAPDRLISGTPDFKTHNFYASADGQRFAGEWTSTPGHWRVVYDEWEYCHILAGQGILHSDDGSAYQLSAGDSFVIEPGFTGSWEVTETMKKLYVIIMPTVEKIS